jgi:RasGEF domain
LDISPLELARQLSLIDFQLFEAIEPHEWFTRFRPEQQITGQRNHINQVCQLAWLAVVRDSKCMMWWPLCFLPIHQSVDPFQLHLFGSFSLIKPPIHVYLFVSVSLYLVVSLSIGVHVGFWFSFSITFLHCYLSL